jgi:prepilin-type N-terminal cleavage/methylation domain-containing protein
MKTIHSLKAGFTLTELLVSAAASLILSGVALMGLVMFQQASQQMDERLVQEAELQRALHFIATDIQEGQRIESGAPARSGYTPLFQIILPHDRTIGYYTVERGNRVWAGPQILYRWDSNEALAYALVDKIATIDGVETKPADVCSGSDLVPLPLGPAGVVVWTDPKNKNMAKVCLLGYLAKSKEGSIKASVVASTRVAP